jgi:hypothetical protein
MATTNIQSANRARLLARIKRSQKRALALHGLAACLLQSQVALHRQETLTLFGDLYKMQDQRVFIRFFRPRISTGDLDVEGHVINRHRRASSLDFILL